MLEKSTYITNCWFSAPENLTIVYPDSSASESSAIILYFFQAYSVPKDTSNQKATQGNQMSMYEHVVSDTAVNYYLAERNIYGSSRIGTTRDTINMFLPNTLPSYGVIGNRNYELSNHLGNVLAVINDITYPLTDQNQSITGYETGLSQVFDYSPFGVQLDGRTIKQEKATLPPDTTINTYTSYIYQGDFENPPVTVNGTDTVSIDDWIHWSFSDIGLHTVSGNTWLKVNSNNGAAGTRQDFNVESGKTYTISIDLKRDGGSGSGSSPGGLPSSTQQTTDSLSTPVAVSNTTNTQTSGTTSLQAPSVVNVVVWNTSTPSGQYNVYQMHNDGTNTFTYTASTDEMCIQIRQKGVYYLDNIEISTEVTDTIIDDGYIVNNNYRYSFQGQESDNEIKGKGNSINYKYRMHDPRVGRFFAVDPLAGEYPHNGPYNFSENIIIHLIELEGLETSPPVYVELNDGKTTEISAIDNTVVIPYTNTPYNPNNNTSSNSNYWWDVDLTGSGESQKDGLYLTSKNRGEMSTKTIPENHPMNVKSDGLINLLGGMAGKKNSGEGVKLFSDGVDKAVDAVQEGKKQLDKAKSEEETNSSTGQGNSSTGHGGTPGNGLNVYEDSVIHRTSTGTYKVQVDSSDAGGYPNENNSRKISNDN